MKQYLISLFLLFCLIAPIGSTYLLLKVQKKQVQRKIKWKIIDGIDRSELVLFKFTELEKQTQLNWKHAKEFEYRGEMYDIAETEVKGDTTWYWCWWDHEETKLNRQLRELVANATGQDPQNRENRQRLIDFFKSIYFLPDYIFLAIPPGQLACTFPETKIFHGAYLKAPPTPPPDFC